MAKEGTTTVKILAPMVAVMPMAALTSRLATGLRSLCISKQRLTALLAVSNSLSKTVSISSMHPLSSRSSLAFIDSSTLAKMSGLQLRAFSSYLQVMRSSEWSLGRLKCILKVHWPMTMEQVGKSGLRSPMQPQRGSSCSCLCFLRLHMQRYSLLQPLISQTYFLRFSLSSRWTCTCCLRLVVVVKDLQHFSQMKGFSWVWMRRWRLRLDFWLNFWSHWSKSHSYGRAPECTSLCRSRPDPMLNSRLQSLMLHMYLTVFPFLWLQGEILMLKFQWQVMQQQSSEGWSSLWTLRSF